MLLEQVLPELRAGKKIRRIVWEEGCFIALIGEGLIVTQNGLRGTIEIGLGLDDWEVVKEETWKDKVSEENPYLCWVSDVHPDTRRYGYIDLVIGYNDLDSLPYRCMSKAPWRYANPVSKEEINSLGNFND